MTFEEELVLYLTDLEEIIRFMMDKDPVGEEWLPDPAPIGTFPKGTPSIELNLELDLDYEFGRVVPKECTITREELQILLQEGEELAEQVRKELEPLFEITEFERNLVLR